MNYQQQEQYFTESAEYGLDLDNYSSSAAFLIMI
jgi:hypothetical protein